MSPSVRAWLLLGVTLLLGICLGVLGGGALQDRRIARVNDIRRPAGFVEHVQAVIQPTEAQWTRIRPLVEGTAQRSAGLRRMHDSAMRVALDSLRAALDTMLDDRQRERLARFVPDRPGGRFPMRRARDRRPGAPPSPPVQDDARPRPGPP